jgi:uncharacterized membrane protein YhhN
LAGGLALSAVGDVLIQRPGGFLAGLAFFLAAHLAYTSGFWRASPKLHTARALPFLLFGSLMGYWITPGTAGMAIPVGAYILTISAMMWRAAALRSAPGADRPVALPGPSLRASEPDRHSPLRRTSRGGPRS